MLFRSKICCPSRLPGCEITRNDSSDMSRILFHIHRAKQRASRAVALWISTVTPATTTKIVVGQCRDPSLSWSAVACHRLHKPKLASAESAQRINFRASLSANSPRSRGEQKYPAAVPFTGACIMRRRNQQLESPMFPFILLRKIPRILLQQSVGEKEGA